MTKKQMIETIQLQEAATFLAFKQARNVWGDGNLANSLRSEWIGVSELMTRLGVAIDYRLPDNQAAVAVIQSEIEAAR